MTEESEPCRRLLKELSDLYNSAEGFIKEVEICQSAVPFPAINELRYAGHHLLKGLVTSDDEIALKALEDAVDHCNRSMYEAAEAGIGYLLEALKSFQTDYKDIPVQPTVPEYQSVQKTAKTAATMLTGGRLHRTSPKAHAAEYMCLFRDLREGLEQLELARDELNKVQDQRLTDRRRFTVKVLIASLATIIALPRTCAAVVGTWSGE